MVLLHDPHHPDAKPIYTRSGWEIPCEYPPRLSRKKLQINAQVLMKNRPHIMLRSVDEYPYNCVGMIFASRRAWIEIDHIYQILNGDGYTNISFAAAKPGDVVLYKDYKGEPSHVALILEVNPVGTTPDIKVLSKWGQDAEFIHLWRDVVDQLGQPAEVWTDRKEHEHVTL